MKKAPKLNILINWCFFLYFAVLFGERIQSIVNCFLQGPDFVFATFFRGLLNILVMVSIAATIILFIILNRDFLSALFTNRKVNYRNLSLTMGVALISGMMHTEYTILYIQFIAYGFLMLALFIQTILAQKKAEHKSLLWIAFLYLISFSMAIPVVYESALEGAFLFHTIEIIMAIGLIVTFIQMCGQLFIGKGEHIFYFSSIIVTMLGDAFLIVFRWNETINWFLLIALIATSVFFIIGKTIEIHYRLDEKSE